MKTTFNARHIVLTDDLKALCEKKLSKFDKFFDDAEATVKLDRVRENECIEVTIASRGTLFRAEKTCKSFSAAIDECVEAIERQIRKNKTRLENRFKGCPLDEIIADVPDEKEDEGSFDIRTKSFAVEAMSTDEAILRMNLLGHTFFIFKDADTGETRVVYKRKFNTYGLILPKDTE